MSLNHSLKSRASLERHRNVLSRAERVARLQEVGRWMEDSTALHMPKVAHRKAKVGKKVKDKKDEAAAATPAAK